MILKETVRMVRMSHLYVVSVSFNALSVLSKELWMMLVCLLHLVSYGSSWFIWKKVISNNFTHLVMSNGYESTLLFCFHVSGYSNCSLLDLGCAKPNYTHVTSPHACSGNRGKMPRFSNRDGHNQLHCTS